MFEIIHIISESLFIFWSALILIVFLIYTVKLVFFKEKEQEESDIYEEHLKRINAATDILLRLHGCKIYEDFIECPSVCKNVKDEDKPDEI